MTPSFRIASPHPIVKLEFNHRDPQLLAGGLMSGQVAYWDIRESSEYVAISNVRDSHRDPVKSLLWIQSKTNTEFYTGSSDGQVLKALCKSVDLTHNYACAYLNCRLLHSGCKYSYNIGDLNLFHEHV